MRIWKERNEEFEGGTKPRTTILSANRAAFVHVPPVYWEFVGDVGYGEFVGLRFYEGVTALADLGLSEAPATFAAFADDMAGTYYGFLDGGADVCALDSHGWICDPLGQDLEAFLAELLEE